MCNNLQIDVHIHFSASHPQQLYPRACHSDKAWGPGPLGYSTDWSLPERSNCSNRPLTDQHYEVAPLGPRPPVLADRLCPSA